ncbi:endolysin [Streptomyces phage Aaronocolus]|uniref:Endolysin n=7 Tax=Likavirus TaxID=1982880 RepID=A0A514U360_9CAUD|nr:endolysin [Streptomyces phage Caliburn]YP_009616451.1 endolysin [Streptomyces phage Aaronocolus]YP_009616526.1 endolysin [Streptomyces phage Hydra]ATE85431.1 endolysin [Streptomyces phage Ozzie]QAY17229.1 endolysin [Streptomyces phage Bovely]QDK03391.1 endolysin [Streptomyces phage Leviticus]QGJ91543.1 endolysin [Streptomyces phage Phettuccine]UJQ86646.1 endolysin [Streptomyces phage Unstoppable]URQ04941.1 endolysin [Streptomyces phage Legacy]
MSVNIISRAEWGAKPWNGTPNSVSLSKRTEFFVHYDGGHPVGRTGYDVPRAIERVHLNQGWSGVGYNFVVDQAGNIYEGRGWGLQGAHCPNHNVSGIGVQIAIGGDQEPSDKALAACRALYDEACRKTGRTLAKKGHKDGFATACPGPKLYAWVKAGMPAPKVEAPAPAPKPSTPAPKPSGDTYTVKRGDTLSGIGARLKIKWTDLAKANNLKAPYVIAIGQKLKLPAKAQPKSTIVALNKAVKPGATHAQVAELQQLLIKAGYGPIPGAVTRYYGKNTGAAVARFYRKNKHLASSSYDTAIGPKGFIELQREAGRK